MSCRALNDHRARGALTEYSIQDALAHDCARKSRGCKQLVRWDFGGTFGKNHGFVWAGRSAVEALQVPVPVQFIAKSLRLSGVKHS